MQVVITKVLPATNKFGTRMVAKIAKGRFVVPFNHSICEAANHNVAALNALGKLEKAFPGCWKGKWVAGDLLTGETVWVNAGLTGDGERVVHIG